MQTMLETWERENPDLEWQSCGERTCSSTGSAVQSTTALSSGESERYALLRSSAHALGIRAMLNDWRYGVECEIRMRCDSRLQGARLLDKDRGKLDILMCASCGNNKQYRKDV